MSVLKIMSLPEKFDFNYYEQFLKEADEFFSNGSFTSIELDFSLVNYLDSSALGMVIMLHKKAKAMNIKTSIKGANVMPAKILMIAHLDRFYAFN
jgi:anti-anti-sigma regulatory factor